MPGFDRFGKRWGSSGQVETPTDNNANLGFAFLGSEPPSAELHNQLFQWLDEKDNYLFALLNEVMRERTGNELVGSPITQLASAIATAATLTKAGIQRNATGQETAAMESSTRTVTPASLKPLIDSLVLGIANSVPSGGILAFARSSAPAGWLVADGRAVSRSQYVDLFNAIGTTFGAGNGSSTFNLPDLRGAFVRGWVSNGTIDAGRGFGSVQQPQNQQHTHVASGTAVPAHTHGFTTAAAGGHTHTNSVAAAGGHTHTASTASAGNHAHSASTGAAGSHAHSGSTNAEGSHTHSMTYRRGSEASGGITVADGFLSISGDSDLGMFTNSSVINAAGEHAHSFTTSTIGNHTHSVSIVANGAHTHGVTVNAVSDHIHSLTINAVANHTHSGTTAAAGGFTPQVTIANEGGENRPYNVALLYCIKI